MQTLLDKTGLVGEVLNGAGGRRSNSGHSSVNIRMTGGFL